MKAILRVGRILAAAALVSAPALAFAQTAPTTNSTSPDAIGPSELQNFNLKGTVTRQADQPVPTPARPQTARVAPPALNGSTRVQEVRTAERNASPVATRPTGRPTVTSSPAPAPKPAAQRPIDTMPVAQSPTPAPAPVAARPAADMSPPASSLAPSRGVPLWPWIAAALALAAGGAFLLWRRRPREMAVAGSQFDLLVPTAPGPEPEPNPLPRAPAPAAAPLPRPAPSAGIVASRLRPTLELGFHPLRCQVDDDQVAIEFELELFNAGTAPARAVLAEASLINAGATQENDLAAFFGNPNGVGERLSLIAPMKRVSFRSQVVAPRAAVQEYELGGRRAFVPVVAFNALYEWSGGRAQSSAAYLVGRDTKRDKLGPLRLDQGAREYHGLGARPLPSAVRT